MIKPVYRVQCDGPCKGWLSLSEDYPPGMDILPAHEVVRPTAERACNWPGEKEATRAAVGAGWRHPVDSKDFTDWLCPGCQSAGPVRPDEEPTR